MTGGKITRPRWSTTRHCVSSKRWADYGYNALQFYCIVMLHGNLAVLFADCPNIYAAGDFLSAEGRPHVRRAPNAMVVIGRLQGGQGHLCSGRGKPAPQVVFAMRSLGNMLREIARKFEFYDRYGMAEYDLIDTARGEVSGWMRQEGKLTVIEEFDRWVLPTLGVRFAGESGAVPRRVSISDIRGTGTGTAGSGGTCSSSVRDGGDTRSSGETGDATDCAPAHPRNESR